MNKKEWKEIEENTAEVKYLISTSRLFQNMFGKTQVIIFPSTLIEKADEWELEEHFMCDLGIRSRGTHSLDLAWSSGYVAKGLGLSSSICETGAYGHDLGHSPFGHDGERYLKYSHGAQSVRLLMLMGIELNPILEYAMRYHSDGDKKINVPFSYKGDQQWKEAPDAMHINDDLCNAARDPFDIVLQGYEAEALVSLVCEILGIKQFKRNEIPKYHYKLLKLFLNDLIMNSKGHNGFYMSGERKQQFQALKDGVYNGFHKRREILSQREECIKWLAAVAEKTEEIIIKDTHSSNKLVRDVQQYLSILDYEKIPSTAREKVIDFITGRCTDASILYYYRNCLK